MGIIDEKGRIFGRINIIDFLLIVFLICIVPAFYLGYKIMIKKPVVENVKKEFVVISTDCLLIKLEPKFLKLISVGDKELDENGAVIGKIVSLGKIRPYIYEFKIGREEKVVKKDTGLMQIEANLDLKVEVINNRPYYKGRQIEVDSPLEFKTHEYTIMAILPAVVLKEVAVEEKMIDLFVTLKDLDEDTLKLISAGDKEVDETGEVISEILSLGKIENNSLNFNLGSSTSIIGENSSKKQISAKMRLRCQVGAKVEEGNWLYFKGRKMEQNLPFEIKTGKYQIKAVLAKTFEVTSPIREKWISLQVKFSGVVPELASVIQKGDIEKDFLEKTAAVISSIIDNKPSQVLTLKENMFINLKHPFYRDILVSLDVQCIEKEGVYYFKNYPVKMGNSIVFSTDLYSITGLIVGLGLK